MSVRAPMEPPTIIPLSRRSQVSSLNQHHTTLKSIGPTLQTWNTQHQQVHQLHRRNRKIDRVQQRRQEEIRRENEILVEKITDAAIRPSTFRGTCDPYKTSRHAPTYRPNTLNGPARKAQNDRIQRENIALAKRIIEKKATHNHKNWQQHSQQHDRILGQISKYVDVMLDEHGNPISIVGPGNSQYHHAQLKRPRSATTLPALTSTTTSRGNRTSRPQLLQPLGKHIIHQQYGQQPLLQQQQQQQHHHQQPGQQQQQQQQDIHSLTTAMSSTSINDEITIATRSTPSIVIRKSKVENVIPTPPAGKLYLRSPQYNSYIGVDNTTLMTSTSPSSSHEWIMDHDSSGCCVVSHVNGGWLYANDDGSISIVQEQGIGTQWTLTSAASGFQLHTLSGRILSISDSHIYASDPDSITSGKADAIQLVIGQT